MKLLKLDAWTDHEMVDICNFKNKIIGKVSAQSLTSAKRIKTSAQDGYMIAGANKSHYIDSDTYNRFIVKTDVKTFIDNKIKEESDRKELFEFSRSIGSNSYTQEF